MGEPLIGSVPLNPPVRLFAPVHDHFPSGEPPLSIGLGELILLRGQVTNIPCILGS